ncbi:MAG: UMP kinase [Patescibacteria group bacterium]
MLHRILLKLSGEQFAGTTGFGIDTDFIASLAQEIREVVKETKTQIIIVVGGGNFLRGATLSKNEQTIERATADYMGMLATLINGMALVDVLEYYGQPARLQSRIQTNSVAEPYIRRRALRHLEKGRVVIVAGGTGNPYVTTDTAAVSAALELECQIVLKATKVDGVYTKDPKKHKDATKISNISFLDAVKNPDIKVMDNAALSLAMDNKLPIRVFDLLSKGNIKKIVKGKEVGTLIS